MRREVIDALDRIAKKLEAMSPEEISKMLDEVLTKYPRGADFEYERGLREGAKQQEATDHMMVITPMHQEIADLKTEVNRLRKILVDATHARADLRTQLKDFREALEGWIEWERKAIKANGPYVGKEINELIQTGESVLAKYPRGAE